MNRYLDCSPAEYHKRDGLSSSIAKIIISQSPLHAWQAHPCLGGSTADRDDPTASMDRGSVIHRLVLGAGADYEVLKFDDFRTNKAREARDAARLAGKVPILEDKFADAAKAAAEVMRRLVDRGIKLDGASERAMEWTETAIAGPVLCRGMMDHLTGDGLVIYDLKVTESASSSSIQRSAESFGYAIQWAAYISGQSRVLQDLGRDADYRSRLRMLFIFAEPNPPYAMQILSPDGMMRELGQRRWRRAVETWSKCIADKHWPAYGDGIGEMSPPPWALAAEPFDMEVL